MMSRNQDDCSGEELRQTHRFLKIQLVTLHSRWHEYKRLFGHSKERVDLLNQCAGGFFHTVQFALLQQIELSIVRLLDPARQGYSNMNMTFSRLVQLAEAIVRRIRRFTVWKLDLPMMLQATEDPQEQSGCPSRC